MKTLCIFLFLISILQLFSMKGGNHEYQTLKTYTLIEEGEFPHISVRDFIENMVCMGNRDPQKDWVFDYTDLPPGIHSLSSLIQTHNKVFNTGYDIDTNIEGQLVQEHLPNPQGEKNISIFLIPYGYIVQDNKIRILFVTKEPIPLPGDKKVYAGFWAERSVSLETLGILESTLLKMKFGENEKVLKKIKRDLKPIGGQQEGIDIKEEQEEEKGGESSRIKTPFLQVISVINPEIRSEVLELEHGGFELTQAEEALMTHDVEEEDLLYIFDKKIVKIYSTLCAELGCLEKSRNEIPRTLEERKEILDEILKMRRSVNI